MKYLLLIVLLFSFGQARADTMIRVYYTGNMLLKICESYTNTNRPNALVDAVRGGTCIGYILGVAEGRCVPNSSSGDQLLRIVIKYLQENPQDLHKGASGLIGNALARAFPCE